MQKQSGCKNIRGAAGTDIFSNARLIQGVRFQFSPRGSGTARPQNIGCLAAQPVQCVIAAAIQDICVVQPQQNMKKDV